MLSQRRLNTKCLQLWTCRWVDDINTGCENWQIRAQRKKKKLRARVFVQLQFLDATKCDKRGRSLWTGSVTADQGQSLRIKSSKMNQMISLVTATCSQKGRCFPLEIHFRVKNARCLSHLIVLIIETDFISVAKKPDYFLTSSKIA